MKKALDKIVDIQSDTIEIFFDGAGCRLDGSGSAYAFVCTTTKEKRKEEVPGLTNNQAEYQAFIAALDFLPDGSHATLYTDSQLVWGQFEGKYKVNDPDLAGLLSQARSLIVKKKLNVDLKWISRARNLAGKVL